MSLPLAGKLLPARQWAVGTPLPNPTTESCG